MGTFRQPRAPLAKRAKNDPRPYSSRTEPSKSETNYLARKPIHHESGRIRPRLRQRTAGGIRTRTHPEGDLPSDSDALENPLLHRRSATANQGFGRYARPPGSL